MPLQEIGSALYVLLQICDIGVCRFVSVILSLAKTIWYIWEYLFGSRWAYMRQWTGSPLFQVFCRLFGTRRFGTMLTSRSLKSYSWLTSCETFCFNCYKIITIIWYISSRPGSTLPRNGSLDFRIWCRSIAEIYKRVWWINQQYIQAIDIPIE